jgi:hypothetical protein
MEQQFQIQIICLIKLTEWDADQQDHRIFRMRYPEKSCYPVNPRSIFCQVLVTQCLNLELLHMELPSA